MSKKVYNDDDGRTVADMSSIERQPLIVPNLKSLKKENQNTEAESDAPEWEQESLNKEQRRAFIGGALTAALVIAGVFIAVGALVIFLITRM